MVKKEIVIQRVCDVIGCYDDECPHRGDWEEKCIRDDWGMNVHYPYCYKANREIPEEIGKPEYNKFPTWCPLQIKSAPRPVCPYYLVKIAHGGDCSNPRSCMFQKPEGNGEYQIKIMCMAKMKTILDDNEETQ